MFEMWEPFCCPWCKVFLVSIKGDVGEQPEPRRDDRCLGTHLCATWLWPLLGSKYVSQLGGWKMQQPGGSGAAKVWGCYSAPFARPSQITQDLLKNPCDLRFVHVSTCFSQRFPRFLVHKGRCWWSQWTAPRQRSPMVNPLEGISPEPRCSQDWSGFWWNWGHPFRKKGWDSMGARG